MMPQSEQHRVFSIPELLESILLHLDMVDLLTSAQRVCKQWRDVIQTSYLLRVFLFLEPQTRRKGALQATKAGAGKKARGGIESGRRATRARLQNPLLKSKILVECFRTYTDEIDEKELERRKAYLFPEASWRRMLFHQPPILEHEGAEPKRLGMLAHLIQKGRV